MHLSSRCGIREVELGGTQADWQSIIGKIAGFERVAHPDFKPFLTKCKNVVNRFVEAFNRTSTTN